MSDEVAMSSCFVRQTKMEDGFIFGYQGSFSKLSCLTFGVTGSGCLHSYSSFTLGKTPSFTSSNLTLHNVELSRNVASTVTWDKLYDIIILLRTQNASIRACSGPANQIVGRAASARQSVSAKCDAPYRYSLCYSPFPALLWLGS